MQKKWVTMGDVARAAGVGKITVSRALSTPDKVSPDTRAKVAAAVAELGYVRDDTAGALSSQRSRVVGAIVSTFDQPTFASTIRGLSEGLTEGGLHLLLGTTQYEPETEAGLVATLMGRRPDALILTSSEHTPETRDMLTRARLPVVELWELPEQPIFAAVGFSNRAAGRAITAHLAETGRRNIAFLSTDRPHDTRARMRAEGYTEALHRHLPGQAPRILRLPPRPEATGPDYGAEGLARVLAQWPDTDAVACVSDALAIGCYCEATRRGLSVPGQLAVTGFGDVPEVGASGIGLTTIRIDGQAIGRKAAALTLAATSGAPLPETRIDMGFTLARRASS
ncbi:MAG: LacI family DNA-binding transcriptional regulator [Vannielia sp.]|uniref:LacI family DNA-binding transcriptional regulator n=1 Tax=Rhodobacterales TaxID=204455 RepID=UPI00209494FD|nr:LacI family DNA-binding transcriptional regulator [Oceanicola sp. 502str15]MCO6384500.1 substrate-binding domain-containing protein [Oceanicola sp. 502str15]